MGTEKNGQTQDIHHDGTNEDGVVEGNQVCAEGMASLKIDPGAAGTYTDGKLNVTVSSYTGKSFVWLSNTAVAQVLVKGGPVTKIFSGGVTGSATSAINPNNGTRYGISHITFCYDASLVVGNTSSSSSGGPVCTHDPLLTDVHFEIGAGAHVRTVDNLRGNVHAGEKVTAVFTVGEGCRPLELTLAAYEAPSAEFDEHTAHLQVLADFETGLYAPGHTYRVDVTVPSCFFQVDFAYGAPIVHLGDDGFYGSRLLSADNGGSLTCSDHKVGICHHTGSETNTWVYIEVDEHAVQAHVRHGDMIGVTEDQCPLTGGNTSSSSSGMTSSSSSSGMTSSSSSSSGSTSSSNELVGICYLDLTANAWLYLQVSAGDLDAYVALGAMVGVHGQGDCPSNTGSSSSSGGMTSSSSSSGGPVITLIDICTLNAEANAYVMSQVTSEQLAAALAAGAVLAVEGACPAIQLVDICTLNAEANAYVMASVTIDQATAALAAGAVLAVNGMCPTITVQVPICQLNAAGTAWVMAMVSSDEVNALLNAGAQLAVNGMCPTSWNSPNKVPCADGQKGFTLYAPGAGVYTDGTLEVIISDYTSNSFKWSSNIGVDSLMVKAGLMENVWLYPVELQSGLGTSVNLSTGEDHVISYVRFCYDVDVQAD